MWGPPWNISGCWSVPMGYEFTVDRGKVVVRLRPVLSSTQEGGLLFGLLGRYFEDGLEDACRNVEVHAACTHKSRKHPLPERRGDLLVADGGLLSFHVQVKVFRSAGQEGLQISRRHTVTQTTLLPSSRVSHFSTCSLYKEVKLPLSSSVLHKLWFYKEKH